MRLLITNLILLLLSFHTLSAQRAPIEVAELSIRVPALGDQEFYYGFEEGDELHFSYTDLSKKGLKQIEVIEYPSNVKYSGVQVKEVTKSIKVNKRGIYLFRFTNSALAQRVGSIKISRLPAKDESINFNTNITWKEIADTTYTAISEKELIRYDTTYTYTTKREVVRVDTIVHELISKSEQVAAHTTMGKPSESFLMVTLPENKTSPYETSEVISWAYWVGVGQEGHQAFEANRKKYMQALGGLADLTGNPLVGLALNQLSFLPTGNAGSNVAYYLLPDYNNAQIFIRSYDNGGFRYFDKGNGVSGYGRREIPLQGTFFIGLHNDNFHNDINVTVKVVAIVVRKQYEERKYKQASVSPIYRDKTIMKPSVSIRKVPINLL